jgi:hypothetical protein
MGASAYGREKLARTRVRELRIKKRFKTETG